MRRLFTLRLASLILAVGLSSSLLAQTSATPAAEPVRVACVGDSITAGAGIRHPKVNGYPAVLGRLLGAGWDVRNFGVSGRTLLKRGDRPYWREQTYTNALAFKPDKLVIMLGTNDSKHPTDTVTNAINNWRYKADFVPDYEAMISAFREVNPEVKVYVCLPVPAYPGRWGITEKTIFNEVDPLIRQVANETGATLIDLHTALSGKAELFPDTVHPNVAGAKLMAEEVCRVLKEQVASSH